MSRTKETKTVGSTTFKTRKEARNAKRLSKVEYLAAGSQDDVRSAIAIVLGMIGREITKSRS